MKHAHSIKIPIIGISTQVLHPGDYQMVATPNSHLDQAWSIVGMGASALCPNRTMAISSFSHARAC